MKIITKGNFKSRFGKLLLQEFQLLPIGNTEVLYVAFDCIKTINLAHNQKIQVLILYEPCAVMPQNYSLKKLRKFDVIVCLNSFIKEIPNRKVINLPQPLIRPVDEFFENQYRINSKIVCICDNKFSGSRTSQYSLRRNLIFALSKNGVSVDLYGPNWNKSRIWETRKRFAALRYAIRNLSTFNLMEGLSGFFKRQDSYVGEAIDKMLTQSRYQFALVIENDKFTLTEKLFDSIFSGCVTFYVGPEFVDPILEKLCIRLPRDIAQAVHTIKSNLKINQAERIKNMKNFIVDSESMFKYSAEHITSSAACEIERYISDRTKIS